MTIKDLKDRFLGRNVEEILETLEVYNVPVDIKSILRDKLEINIVEKLEWDKLAFDGSVYLNNKGYPEIWLNSAISENRQNFTLAHELGHIINDILPKIDDFKDSIDDNYDTLYRSSNSNPMEVKANIFAAEFLMPEKFISQEARNLAETNDFDSLSLKQVIQRMADRFRVSFDAMKWRLVNLGYINKNKL